MSARLASGDTQRDRQPTCSAPSCWAPGVVVEIVDSGEEPPVLCESCRKQYLGVST